MRAMQMLLRAAFFVSIGVGSAMAQTGPTRPADGYTVHIVAPHVVNGKIMGPYHHYCKVVSPEPVIECLIYESTDPSARLEQIEYIIAKSITRNGSVLPTGTNTGTTINRRLQPAD
jgi:hypothetical protein